MLALDVFPFLIFSLVCVFPIVRAFPQNFWITRLDTFTDFLPFRAKLPKPAGQKFKSLFFLPSPFFPPPTLPCPASPGASALKAQQVTAPLSGRYLYPHLHQNMLLVPALGCVLQVLTPRLLLDSSPLWSLSNGTSPNSHRQLLLFPKSPPCRF